MKNILLAGAGGFIGAAARYLISGVWLQPEASARFPLGTFAVNVIGCLVGGLVAGLIERQGLFSAETRLFLLVGVLGGFTTFSAFSFETVLLWRRGDAGAAIFYAAISVAAGLAAFAGGLKASILSR